MVWIGNNWPFGQENRFCAKKTPHFHLFWWIQTWVTWLWKDLDAKPLTPGQLLGYPWKLAMWRVGGTKIERTRACHIFLVCVHGNSRKKCFFGVKRSVPENFQPEIFLGLPPAEFLRTQDLENYARLGWPSLRFEVIAAKSEVIGQKPKVLKKMGGVTMPDRQRNFAIDEEWRIHQTLCCESSILMSSLKRCLYPNLFPGNFVDWAASLNCLKHQLYPRNSALDDFCFLEIQYVSRLRVVNCSGKWQPRIGRGQQSMRFVWFCWEI